MEIERKWLVERERIPYDLAEYASYAIEQAYVSFSPTIRIRKINGGEQYVLTVKTHPENLAHPGLQREEVEVPLSAAEYAALLQKTAGNVVSKTRYVVPLENGWKQEIDIFHGALDGLVCMEIEFPDTDSAEKYPDPAWVTADVTYDFRYKNSSLAEYGKPREMNT